jgi:hypothetical protein
VDVVRKEESLVLGSGCFGERQAGLSLFTVETDTVSNILRVKLRDEVSMRRGVWRTVYIGN